MKSSGYLNNAKGAVAPLVAIMLVVIIACVAVVVDLGHIHNVKIQLQRAVDAAALGGANELPDEDSAVDAAEAWAAANIVDQEAVVIDPDTDIVLGTWNKEIVPGETAADRFDETGTPPNAIKVTASRVVDHVFFFFLPSTTVTADAIAIYQYVDETIPIALVSCIPTGGGSLNIASPGLSVCDIATYEFHSDTEDTAAWTSLTFKPADNPTIKKFLTEEGRELFNEVVYGTGSSPEHKGIENTTVETDKRTLPVPDIDIYEGSVRGCTGNNGTSIQCGLGDDISVGTESIDEIQQVDTGKLTPPGEPTDPLAYTPLPRWYHFDRTGASPFDPTKDAFTRVWTQDGHLVPPPLGTGDQNHLKELFETPDGILNSPYGAVDAEDFRFKKFIELKGTTYKPNFNEVLRYAGYPPVWVNNGAIPNELGVILNRIVEGGEKDGTYFKGGKDNEPFDDGNQTNSGAVGQTVRLTIPVIFAGDCDSWKAISSGPVSTNLTLFYIGTADFLVTRAWKNNKCYEYAPGNSPAGPVSIKNNPSEGTCTPSDTYFDPSIAAGVFECTTGKTPNVALEGLIRPPTRGEETVAGIKKIYLVE